MPVYWTSDLEVGVPLIDQQHQQLFVKLNDLLEACQQRHGREMIGKVMKFLEYYVMFHFEAEETLMMNTQYPGRVSHRQLHQAFVRQFGELAKLLASDGPGPHVVIQANQIVLQWLNDHIRTIDKDFGTFLIARN